MPQQDSERSLGAPKYRSSNPVFEKRISLYKQTTGVSNVVRGRDESGSMEAVRPSTQHTCNRTNQSIKQLSCADRLSAGHESANK